MTQDKLDKLNAERRRRGQREISTAEARAWATSQNKAGSDDEAFAFLIGLAGIPYPSGMGMAGFAVHEATTPTPAPAVPESSHSETRHHDPAPSHHHHDSGSSDYSSHDSGHHSHDYGGSAGFDTGGSGGDSGGSFGGSD